MFNLTVCRNIGISNSSENWQISAHNTCVNGSLLTCECTVSFCSFSFWFLGLLSPKRTQLRVLLVIVFHEVGFPDYISRPPATLKHTESTTRVLPLLTAAPPPLRLQPDRSRAPAIGRVGLRNCRLCDSDSDQDDLSFAFGNLSIMLSSTSTSSRYYTCNLFVLFCLIGMFNLSSVRVVLTLVAMIYDVLNLVVLYIMNYIMVLIWKLSNISTYPTMYRLGGGSWSNLGHICLNFWTFLYN
jgi:hypothetical protein